MVNAPTDMTKWYSTYGLLTAERILARFNIHLKQDELATALKDQHGFYYLLLHVPFKNVINGIILGQACDYRMYAQKIFIDYLMAGGSSDSSTIITMTGVRENLEEERKHLVEIGTAFENLERDHQRLIAESQRILIDWSKNLSYPPTAAHYADLQKLSEPYVDKTTAMQARLCDYRSQFYNLILRCNDYLQLLPDYRPDVIKQQKNREELDFNAKIGEK